MTTREHILEGSTKLFLDQGIKAVRMDDIAVHLAISKRTIYEIFSDKKELVEAVLEYMTNKHNQEQLQCIAGAQNLMEELVRQLKWWEESATNMHRFIREVKRFYPDVFKRMSAEHARTGTEMMRTKLHQGIEQGLLLPSIDVELTIYVITNSIAALALEERTAMPVPANVSDRDVFRFIIVFFFRGLATEKGIKIIDEYINNK